MTKNEIEDAILVARRIALSGAAGSPVDGRWCKNDDGGGVAATGRV